MPILNIETSADDKERFKRELKDTIDRRLTETFKSVISTYNSIFGMIWQNENGLTPQECFDGLGTDALKLMQVAGAFKQVVNSIKPGAISVSSPIQVSPNADGTITVVKG